MISKWKVFEAINYVRYIDTPHFGRRRYPVPIVRAMHDSTAVHRIMRAPARTSKSYSAAADLCPDLLDFDAPPTKHLICGPDYDKASKEFQYIWDWLVVGRHDVEDRLGAPIPAPVEARNRPDQGKMMIRWPWGAELHAKSAARFSSLIGDQWGKCILSETCEHDAFTFFRGLRTRCERFLMPTTPSVKGRWVKEFTDQNLDNPDVQEFVYPPSANPMYDMDRFRMAQAERGADDPGFREQFLGDWVYYGGRVFPTFQNEPIENLSGKFTEQGIAEELSTGCHNIELDPLEIPSHWMRIAGMDYGWRDATVHLWLACAPDGTVIVYDEYYENQRGSRAHIEEINMMSRWNGTDAAGGIKDRVREPKSMAAQIAEDHMIEHGFVCRPVEEYDRFSARMTFEDYLIQVTNTGLPSIRIIGSRCPNLVRELMTLHYDRAKIHREGSLEHYLGDDHAIQALLYALTTRPRTRAAREREELDPMSIDALKKRRRLNEGRKRRIGVEAETRRIFRG